jgi:UDPglucose--hexose-1-phosphate uridylyltransferase
MSAIFNTAIHPHKRLNILTNEWVLVSPHRNKRPWQGKQEELSVAVLPEYDKDCYLCAGNKRDNGAINPKYTGAYSFVNDFAALMPEPIEGNYNNDNLLIAQSESGICKVICFSPNHGLTLPQMNVEAIEEVVQLWKVEYEQLQEHEFIKYIQIFENKGSIMGCSNPHPHGQIWASSELPQEISKEDNTQRKYYASNGKTILQAYIEKELDLKERIVLENESFVALVPYWAIWPYEILLVSKKHRTSISEFSQEEIYALAEILKGLTTKYDNLFECSFPYSAGMHQAPVNCGPQQHWHWHMHFYPPLLRSATVKKFMVGYEMLANAQRDITPEMAAATLSSLSLIHYSNKS